jgi:hypothetical protein
MREEGFLSAFVAESSPYVKRKIGKGGGDPEVIDSDSPLHNSVKDEM